MIITGESHSRCGGGGGGGGVFSYKNGFVPLDGVVLDKVPNRVLCKKSTTHKLLQVMKFLNRSDDNFHNMITAE